MNDTLTRKLGLGETPGRLISLAAVVWAGLLAGCHDEPATAPADSSELSTPWGVSYSRADITVRPGGSIQDAVDGARRGDVIHIEPGVYEEVVVVEKARISLVGLGDPDGEDVEIVNPGSGYTGITVTGDRFALVNVTVRGFHKNGVLLEGVQEFLLSDVRTEDNGEYGLFPHNSSRGLITNSSASGHSDTGIYVGQSSDVEVRRSVAFANVIGFEIENSSDIKAIENEAFDNVAGILVVLLPGLGVKASSDIRVAKNDVHDNNRANFAEPGELASAVPSGSGILVVGADRTEVKQNSVAGNNFVGIGVGSSLLLGALAGLPPEAFADIEPNPDRVRVRDNTVLGNGASPPPLPFPGVDLFWDGSGTENCWSGNTFATSFPPDLPACA